MTLPPLAPVHCRSCATTEYRIPIRVLLATVFGHHAAAISLAIVTGEEEAIVHGISRRETASTGHDGGAYRG
eukprot:6922196-Prymnesium_polylepis.1